MTKEELTTIKGGIGYGILNVISGVSRLILTTLKNTIFPIKFRI